MSDSLFAIPPDVRFSCTQCGDCCRSWNVLLGPGEAERIEGLDWAGREDALADVAVTAPVAAGKLTGRRLARRPGGACVFLGADNGCLIHRHFGEQAKPLLCRMYPFAFVRTGGRVAVDCSFACRSIARGSGEPLEVRTPEWLRLLEESPAAEANAPRLDAKRALKPETLWELEHGVAELLNVPELPFFVRLRCAMQFAELSANGDPEAPMAGELRGALRSTLPRRMAARPAEGTMNATQRALFLQEVYAHLNPPPEGEGPRQMREREWVAAGEAFRDGRGNPRVDGQELKVSWSDIRRVSLEAVGAAGEAVLARWLTAAVVGQRFRFAADEELPFGEAVARLALRYPMALWGAKALAAERGTASVGVEDLQQAIRLIDRAAGRIPLGNLDNKQRAAVEFVLRETGAIEAAVLDVTHGRV
ncbi:MAG: lysine-N-methylase [Candidatus Sumerlaeota bacterium]|nr:lysine-N-methylase [Candidatus Sumerlaeota bacterium]